MTETIKAAIIGAGILGSQHAATLQAHPDATLLAVADVRLDAAERLAAVYGVQAYDDYVEMLRRQHPDLVIVATPDALHREPVIAALEAGTPCVIQEKPLATTRQDAEAIYEAVEKRGARLFVNYANRAAPLDLATYYTIQKGLLGRPVYGESRLDDNISVPTRMWGPRTRDWTAGSSTAHFLLSHVVDLLHWYFSPARVSEVYAIAQRRVLGYTPDLYDAFLTFDSGIQVRIKAEWIKRMDELVEFYLCFSGDKGTLIYNKRAGFGTSPGWRANIDSTIPLDQLVAHQHALVSRGIHVDALLHQASPETAGGDAPLPALEFRGMPEDRPQALVEHFIAAIRQDTLQPSTWQDWGPLPTHQDGLAQTLVVTAIEESAQSGRVIDLR